MMSESKQSPSSIPKDDVVLDSETENGRAKSSTSSSDQTQLWKSVLSHRWGFSSVVFIASLAIMIVLSLARNLPWDAATVALAFSLAVLILSLRSLWSMVETLSSAPDRLNVNGGGDVHQKWNSRAAIREEKNRVLRALKELDFDHSMGKLAENDYLTIRDRYRLRAVQAIRALEQNESLHPDLQRWLDEDHEDMQENSSVLVCSSCSVENDSDAKFCKSCGTRLSA